VDLISGCTNLHKTLRDTPVDAPLGSPVEVRPGTLALSFDDLLAAAQASFPVLKRQQALVEANRFALELARKEVRPNFTLFRTGRWHSPHTTPGNNA
jgi:hypothetical protein